ncbi:MAG: thiol reductase thioredoxin [Limnothrix sp. RL_2_0]|nr:thiol reductase thioredoxin [Limnothrix sp. RL_2_0]
MGAAEFIENEAELEVALSSESVLVMDCTATWCGPCRLIAPLIDKLAAEYGDRAKVSKMDMDSNQAVGKRFGLRSIPAVLFFKEGELQETVVGAKAYEDYTATLEKYLA